MQLADLDQLVDLCSAHAAYEKAEYSKAGKAEQLAKDLFSEFPKLYCLVATSNATLIGFASFMKQYATWDAKEYIYMDCLFLDEAARGKGIGQRLVERIALEGRKMGCDLIQWQTPDFNARAISFYERLGAERKAKERFFLDI